MRVRYHPALCARCTTSSKQLAVGAVRGRKSEPDFVGFLAEQSVRQLPPPPMRSSPAACPEALSHFGAISRW
jgi:hypothetical protein